MSYPVDQDERHPFMPNAAGDCLGCLHQLQDHPARVTALDKLRGLAVLAMVVDHVALFAGVDELRMTVGRLAVPVFFIVAGHLVRRLSWRHGWVFLVGLALPLVVPWIDDPNVLCWYAAGAALLVLLRRLRVPVVLVVVLVLTIAANETSSAGPGYDPWSLFALMALGSMLRRRSFDFAKQLPHAFVFFGRFPLSIYVGHLLLIEIVRAW